MQPKQIDVTCPCCQSRLAVDVLTQRVVRAARPEERDAAGRPKVGEADWDQALGKVRERDEGREGKMDSALERERARRRQLDDLFDQARRKLEQDPDRQTDQG